jgi:replicative DNA helicase
MTSPQEPLLAQYGKAFQERACQAMLVDPQWCEQLVEIFDPSYFEQKHLVYLTSKYFDYAKKYKAFPTWQLLITIVNDSLKSGNDALLREQIIKYLHQIKLTPNFQDLPYIRDKMIEFCRKQAFKQALEHAVDFIAQGNYEQCVEVVKKAILVGTTPQVGHELLEDFDARFSRLKRNCIPTGLKELDQHLVLDGGLGAGEFGVVVGNAGAGKSHWLTFVGAQALMRGKNIIHYTLELSETQVGVRYDSILCEIDANEVLEHKQKIIDKYKDMKLGRLFIKQFPTGTATIYTLKSHVERLMVTKDFKPDMIVIDYADIMRSTKQFDSIRHELKLVYEELRGWAMEIGVPIWSASQSNREGASSEIVDLTNMSESYAKAAVCDVIVSISRKPEEKASGHGRLYMAKNRSGKDGILWPMHMNTARSTFEITGSPASLQEEKVNDEAAMKQRMKARWNELSGDATLAS